MLVVERQWLATQEIPKKTKKREKKCGIFFVRPWFCCQRETFYTLFYEAQV
jgi:hypothetical protein